MIAQWLGETTAIALVFSVAITLVGAGLGYAFAHPTALHSRVPLLAAWLIVPAGLLGVNRGLLSVDLLLLVIYTVAMLPLCAALFGAAFGRVSSSTLDAARLDGAVGWQLFRRIVLPVTARTWISALFLAFVLWWIDYAIAALLVGRSNLFWVRTQLALPDLNLAIGVVAACGAAIFLGRIVVALVPLSLERP